MLAVSESRVQIDDQFRGKMMQFLRTEAPYEEMIQTLEDPKQPNEIQINDRAYRIKHGILKVHEKDQKMAATFWRTVIPNEVEVKRMIEGITLCTIFWTSRFYSHIRNSKTILLLETHESRCAGFCLGLSHMPGRKR